MKKTLALVSAVIGLLAVQKVQATPYDTTSTPVSVAPAKTNVAKTKSKRAVYYITSVQATGSHLPVVICRYDGQCYAQSPISVYGKPQLDRTGQLNVIGELVQRDPAISVSSGHR